MMNSIVGNKDAPWAKRALFYLEHLHLAVPMDEVQYAALKSFLSEPATQKVRGMPNSDAWTKYVDDNAVPLN